MCSQCYFFPWGREEIGEVLAVLFFHWGTKGKEEAGDVVAVLFFPWRTKGSYEAGDVFTLLFFSHGGGRRLEKC